MSVRIICYVVLCFGSTSANASTLVNIDLGTAGLFGVLAGTSVTNTGATHVIGDVGASLGTVSGFPPGVVIGGTIHDSDAIALQAESDLTVAYNSAVAEPCGGVLTGQDLVSRPGNT